MPLQAKKAFVPLPVLEGAAAAPLPVRLAFSQRLGRHLLATHALPAGTFVLRETPAAFFLQQHAAPFFCAGCRRHIHGGSAEAAKEGEYK